MSDFDIIIIGGRPAGATLAARLGKLNLNVLLLERATHPQLPAASSPIVYASTMKLLDEIGADEAEYAAGTPKIHRLHFSFEGETHSFPIPDLDGRNYAYAVDRARFDHALWNTAIKHPTVTGKQGFHVKDLLWEGDRVIGVIGYEEGQEPQEFTADLVVGADGRFGIVARKTNAEVLDEHDELPTTLHYAYWKNIKPIAEDEPAASVAYTGEFGLGYLVMDSADNTAAVCVEGQAALLNPPAGQSEAFYLEQLRKQPDLWQRLEGAEMVTSVRGMKKISNSYRQAGGKGWALVGDAYHQKDPLDGQGIYNAAFTAKALAWAIRYWQTGEMTWTEALAWYDETARIKTYGMYKRLLKNVEMNLYSTPAENGYPEWLQDLINQYAWDDPRLGQLLGGFLTRQVPAEVMPVMIPATMMGAVVRGRLREIRNKVEAQLPPPIRR